MWCKASRLRLWQHVKSNMKSFFLHLKQTLCLIESLECKLLIEIYNWLMRLTSIYQLLNLPLKNWRVLSLVSGNSQTVEVLFTALVLLTFRRNFRSSERIQKQVRQIFSPTFVGPEDLYCSFKDIFGPFEMFTFDAKE